MNQAGKKTSSIIKMTIDNEREEVCQYQPIVYNLTQHNLCERWDAHREPC